jgi:hypothetical protein
MMRDRTQMYQTLFCAVLVAVTLWAPQVGAAPPDPKLKVEPADLEVRPNEGFQLKVMIEDVESLGGFQVELAYDPSVMEVQDAALGDFVTSTGRSEVPVGPNVNNEEGTVALGAATFGDAPGADGSGVLAIINCRALGEGNSALTLQNVQVLDVGAGQEPVQTENGRVVVTAATAQQGAGAPSTRWGLIGAAALLALVGATVLVFGILRRAPEEAGRS